MLKKIYILSLILSLFLIYAHNAWADLEHQVKPKETLTSIARLYNITIGEIIKANNIKDPNVLYAGQILIIPSFNPEPNNAANNKPETVLTPLDTENSTQTNNYKIQPGDTLSTIALKFNISLEDLIKANSIENTDNIKSGHILIIPQTNFSPHVNSVVTGGNIIYVNEEGVINETVISLLAKPVTDSGMLSQGVLGDRVNITAKKDNWRHIVTSDGFSGWTDISFLSPVCESNILNSEIIVAGLIVDILDNPDGIFLKKAVMGTTLPLNKSENGWLQVLLPQGKMGWIDANNVIFESPLPQLPEKIVETAKMYLGVPYMWAGITATGVDCSGFIYAVYKMNGYRIPRDAESQFNYCEKKKDEELIPGDLVFFTTYLPGPSHVGIYIGDRNFIHASSGKGVVTVSSLDQEYYKARYLGGGRIKEMKLEK